MSNNYSIQQLLKKAAFYLHLKGKTSPRSDAELILSFLLKKERSFFYAHSDVVLNNSLVEDYWELIKRRGKGEPFAYITGQKEFMGLPFVVEKGVLIPRPETEHLVEYVIEWLQKNKPWQQNDAGFNILDIGTGCGNIAIALACHFPAARIIALDKDEHALKVAAINGKRFGVMSRLEFVCGSLRDLLHKRDCSFHVVVSNPPYIPTDLLATLSPEVLSEPQHALDGGADGLDIYREIFRDIKECLLSPGILALEIGKGQAFEVCALAGKNGPWRETIVLKDYAGIERVCCFIL